MKKLTKSKLTEKCRDILYKYDGIVSDEKDKEFLISIFRNHPNWNKKQGIGIERIETKTNPTWKNKCFWIYRLDGTNTDISFKECISSTPINTKLKLACRNAISTIILEEREVYKSKLPFICPICGKLISTEKDFHIDHYDLTFDEVFNNWLITQNINILIQYLNDESQDGISETKFTNQDIIDNFVKFHNDNTHLRAVHVSANLSILRKK